MFGFRGLGNLKGFRCLVFLVFPFDPIYIKAYKGLCMLYEN